MAKNICSRLAQNDSPVGGKSKLQFIVTSTQSRAKFDIIARKGLPSTINLGQAFTISSFTSSIAAGIFCISLYSNLSVVSIRQVFVLDIFVSLCPPNCVLGMSTICESYFRIFVRRKPS